LYNPETGQPDYGGDNSRDERSPKTLHVFPPCPPATVEASA